MLGAHGGYTFYALNNGKIDKAYIVDGYITPATEAEAQKYPQLNLISGQPGDADIARKVGPVDAIIMFDIILHQVAPDWDAFLEMWGSQCKYLIIYNQNWAKDDKVVRFADFDVDWFIKNVSHSNDDSVRSWYQKHDNFNEELGCKWRDVHYFWQFGIPLKSLVEKLEKLSFTIDYVAHDTPWSVQYPWVTNDVILASRSESGAVSRERKGIFEGVRQLYGKR